MNSRNKALLLCASSLMMCSAAAVAQTVPTAKPPVAPPAKPPETELASAAPAAAAGEDIVVTGFRGSLEKGLQIKQDAIAVVDSIIAEDIGKFPTQNIAEALQRLPGVDLVRNEEANEGNRIQLRGLGPEFTLTTFNGAPVRTTSAGNIGTSTRDFNYDIFSSELFTRADVYKTPLAELEEGGVAGVVNLRTPRPFDRPGRRFAYSLQGTYNDQARYTTPRGHLQYSVTKGDLGIALGIARSGNRTRRGGFESTGMFFNEQANIDFNGSGVFNNNYNPAFPTQNPPPVNRNLLRTPGTVTPPPGGTPGLDTFRLDFFAPGANLNGYTVPQLRTALVPRLLRVTGTQNERERFSMNAALQYKTDDAEISLDMLYAKLDDVYQRQILGFAPRGTTRYSLPNGQPNLAPGSSTNIPAWVPLKPTIDENGLLGGTFGNVTMQNAAVYRNTSTEFANISLNGRFRLTERLNVVGQAGYTNSTAEAYAHTAILNSLSQLNEITYNISDPFAPTLSTKRDVTDPVLNEQLQLSGNFRDENDTQRNLRLVFDWEYGSGRFSGLLKVGGSYVSSVKDARQYTYGNAVTAANTANPLNTKILPAALGGLSFATSTPANQRAFIQTILTPVELSGFGGDSDGPFPTSWLHLSRDYLDDELNADGAARGSIFNAPAYFNATENVKAAFIQSDFAIGDPGNRLRGNVGVRYIDTETIIDNFAGANIVTTKGGYQNWLPSVSLAYDITTKLIVRALYNKTLTRSSINLIARPVNIPNTGVQYIQRGNPDLRPQLADSIDLIGEWYFDRGGIVSIGYFKKILKGRPVPQTTQVPFRDLGLDSSLFTSPINTGAGVNPDELFTVDTFVNLDRYEIKGFEGAYQQQFRFLPKPFDGLGAIASLTLIETADLPWTATNGTVYRLRILPKVTASGTLYYEKGPLSVRTSVAYKGDRFGGSTNNNGIDTQNWDNPRTYWDASFGYRVKSWLELRVDLQNMTNTRTYNFARQVDGLYGDENSRVDNAYEAGRNITFGIRGSF